MFHDRIDAGLALAEKLKHYKNTNSIILAVPRGGVPVAAPIAAILNLPMEPLLAKKIGHPLNEEFAIGAVNLIDVYLPPQNPVSEQYIEEETQRIRSQLQQMREQFMGNKQPTLLTGKIVIIVDDGIATGHTLLSTIAMIKKASPQKLVVAIPVASQSAAQKLSEVVDEFICELIPDRFSSVSAFYKDFTQVTDEEVIQLLQ